MQIIGVDKFEFKEKHGKFFPNMAMQNEVPVCLCPCRYRKRRNEEAWTAPCMVVQRITMTILKAVQILGCVSYAQFEF